MVTLITVEVRHRDGTIISSSTWNDRDEAEAQASYLRTAYAGRPTFTVIVTPSLPISAFPPGTIIIHPFPVNGSFPWHNEKCDAEARGWNSENRLFWCYTHGQWVEEAPVKHTYTYADGSVKEFSMTAGTDKDGHVVNTAR